MKRRAPLQSLVLAIHPTAHGFGWIAFSGPFTPFDWSIVDAATDKNAVCLRKLERLLDRLRPETIVLEAYRPPHARRSMRVQRLCEALVASGIERRIEVAIYTHADIRACFATVGARTRQEIAEAVARQLEPLRPKLPVGRKPWDGPSRRMGLFSAAALALTHYRLGASTLFEGLLGGM